MLPHDCLISIQLHKRISRCISYKGRLYGYQADGDSYMIAMPSETRQGTVGRRGVKVVQNWTAKLER